MQIMVFTPALKYAATLAFSPDLRKVALVKKNKPDFLRGKWTAIGGQIERGEQPVNAAIRELMEESGLYADYRHMVPFVRTERPMGACLMYATVVDNIDFAQTKTDEKIMVWTVATLPAYSTDLSDDLCAHVEMAKMALRKPNSVFFVQQELRS